MTTTVKIHVNGNYRATVKQGSRPGQEVQIGPNEEKSFGLPHPATDTFEITEEYLGEKAADPAPAGDDKSAA
jgi:hypothetical protein